MATEQQVEDLIGRFNAATNAVATKIRTQRDKIAELLAAGGLTGDQETAALAALDGIAAQLEAVAADPDNPIPEEPPVEPAPPTV